MVSFPEGLRLEIISPKERRERNARAAIERRRLYRHISNYPVSLLNEITQDGSITVGEQDELQRYMYWYCRKRNNTSV